MMSKCGVQFGAQHPVRSRETAMMLPTAEEGRGKGEVVDIEAEQGRRKQV
jgi:hypothetical protein